WDEAAVVAPGQGSRQMPDMECSHHDRDGVGGMRVPRLGHQKAHLGFERAARRWDWHAALTEQLADFLGVELFADDLGLFIQWQGASGGRPPGLTRAKNIARFLVSPARPARAVRVATVDAPAGLGGL